MHKCYWCCHESASSSPNAFTRIDNINSNPGHNYWRLKVSALQSYCTFAFNFPTLDCMFFVLCSSISRDNELRVTLWGLWSTTFSLDSIYNDSNPRAIVCLFVGCVPKEFQSTFSYHLQFIYHRIYHACTHSWDIKNLQEYHMWLETTPATGI